MKRWYTAAELAELTLPDMPGTKQGVAEVARREGWQERVDPDGKPLSRRRQGRGGGWEYNVALLPERARAALAARHAPVGEPAADESTSSQRGLAETAGLDERRRRRAEARAAIVHACRRYIRDGDLQMERGLWLFAEAYNRGEVAVAGWVQSEVERVSRGSLRNWWKQLDREGLARLAGKYGNRRGTGQIDRVPEMREVVEAMLYTYPHASAKHVMRALRARFAEDQMPAFRTVQRYITQWKKANKQVHAKAQSPDGWRSAHQAASGVQAETVARLNQVWELDSTKADVMLADGKRHAIIAGIDVYSRRLKLVVDRTSRSGGIAALLRRSLLDWGVPEAIKTDNGTDYVSRHITGVFAALDIDQQLCPPFSPDKKPFVERALKTFLHDLVELLPGYTGHNVAERKALEDQQAFADRLMRAGDDPIRDVQHLTPAQLQDICDRWCENIYEQQPHGGLGGKSPFEVAQAWGQRVRRIEDERALDVLLSAPVGDGWRTVRKKGIQLFNTYYDDPALGGLEGQRVQVLIDEADASHLFVFSEQGEFVCKAFAPEASGLSRQELAAKRRANQRQAVNAGTAALRRSARSQDVSNIAGEILDQAEQRRAKVASFPTPSETHRTGALDEAGKAARAGRAPEAAPRSAAEEEQHRRVVEDLSAHRPAAKEPFQPPKDPLERTILRLDIADAQACGEAFDADAVAWAQRYAATDRGRREMETQQEFAEARRALRQGAHARRATAKKGA